MSTPLSLRSVRRAAVRALLVISAATGGVSAVAADASIDHSGLPGATPLVAVDPDGNATVVWMQSSKLLQPRSLWSNRHVAKSDAWAAARTPLTAAHRAYTGHDVAAAPGGDVFVLAKDEDNAVVHRYSAQSGSWDKEWLLDKGRATRFDARIAVDSRGNALAVWTRRDAAQPTPKVALWASYYVAGDGQWRAPEVISAPTDWASDPSLAFDGKGDAIVAWSERKTTQVAGTESTEGAIRVRRFTGGAWESELPVFASHASSAPGALKSRLAVSRNGTATLAWVLQSRVWAVRYAPGASGRGAWGSPVEIDAGGGPDRGGLALAMDDSGNAMAVWSQQAAGDVRGGVYSSRFLASGSPNAWGKAQYVGSNSGEPVLNDATLVMDATGHAFVAWTEQGPRWRNRLYTNRHAPGAGWGEASAIVRSDILTAADPSLAVGTNGTVMLAWLTTDNKTLNIVARRLR